MEESYISGEEHQARQHSKSAANQKSPLLWIVIALTFIVLCLGSFIVLKLMRHNPTNLTDNTGMGQSLSTGGGPGGGNAIVTCTAGSQCTGPSQSQNGHPPTAGTVTARSATSITIQPSGGGNSQTYTITSSTQETDGGPNQGFHGYNPSDITIGETVGVVTSSNNSQADMIILNFKNQPITQSN